ncbi:HEAT repeat domain-containing protein [Planctomicrobium sp. SH661]|uniref:HEAT repeat domain-containing protein n=1 Tax=Planctomicrobium sp. SH661 TaxID=3448124 RepID=UPI003F5CAB82
MSAEYDHSWKILCACLALTGMAYADVVRLREGGEVRGEILGSGSQEASTSVQTQSGTRITIDREEIDFVERRSPLMEEYITRSRQIPQTAEAKWELAEWCRTQNLLDERKEQLEELLDIDPDHEAARKILGYVRHLGRWMTREDEMAERGYLRHNGRWVTRQELELKLANASQQEAELAWMPKVRVWLMWLTGNDAQRSANGLAELKKIEDPDAIAALNKHLGQHPQEDVRLLFVDIISKMEGPRSVPPLVDRILMDGSHFVRGAALRGLTPARHAAAVPALIAALRHKSNTVLCHAAEALGEIGDLRAVPALIDALVTRHPVQIQVPANQGITFSNGGAIGPLSGTLPPGVEIAARTGQLPYGATVVPNNVPVAMKKVTVTREFKNLPVLSALEKMTGNNLGFNERDWHFWWALQKS